MVALVLLPGLDGTGLLFPEFAASLGPEVKAIVASYPADIPLGYSELEPIARSFLPQDQPFFLLAESFSGPIAISIAASAPPGLLGLVLCCTFARSPLPLPGLFRAAAAVIPLGVFPTSLACWFLLGRFKSSALRGMVGKVRAMVAPAVLRARARAALSVDVSALLPRIGVPMLYLRAAEDRVIPRSSCELIASLAPHTKVVEFSTPHLLLKTLPSAAASVIAEFMGVHHNGPKLDRQ